MGPCCEAPLGSQGHKGAESRRDTTGGKEGKERKRKTGVDR